MEWFCSNCWGEGEISYKYIKRPVAVRCKNYCGYLDAYVWCNTCGMGGQIAITDFNARPAEWVCADCGTPYKLPETFYEHIIEFVPQAFASKPPSLLPIEKRFAYITPQWLAKLIITWEKHYWKVALLPTGLFLLVILAFLLEKGLDIKANPLWQTAVFSLSLASLAGIGVFISIHFLVGLIQWLVEWYWRWQRRGKSPHT